MSGDGLNIIVKTAIVTWTCCNRIYPIYIIFRVVGGGGWRVEGFTINILLSKTDTGQ